MVREIAGHVLARRPLYFIEGVLNGRGDPGPRGRGWTAGTIRRTVMSPTYAARRIHQGQVIGDGDWPAILDAATYDKVSAILSDPRRRLTTGAATLTYQLSHLARCGPCGGRLTPLSSPQGTKYRCAARGCMRVVALVSDMDATVDAFVLERLQQPNAAQLFAPPAPNDAPARDHLAALRARLQDHYDQAATGALSAAGLVAVEARLLPQIEAAERELANQRRVSDLGDVDLVEVAANWPDAPVALRRRIIAAMAEVVLSPAGKGVRFTHERLRDSRWRGDPLTWGERWK